MKNLTKCVVTHPSPYTIDSSASIQLARPCWLCSIITAVTSLCVSQPAPTASCICRQRQLCSCRCSIPSLWYIVVVCRLLQCLSVCLQAVNACSCVCIQHTHCALLHVHCSSLPSSQCQRRPHGPASHLPPAAAAASAVFMACVLVRA